MLRLFQSIFPDTFTSKSSAPDRWFRKGWLRKEMRDAHMDAEKWSMVNILLVLLVALFQFLLHLRPQNEAVKELEARLEQVEARLAELQGRWPHA
jgi:hypothetical protein